ncbi:MAG: ComEC/Rec2 family competence protein, partial [Rikenellaceae bacterium]
MSRFELTPFLRITTSFTLGVVAGAWGFLSLIIPIIPLTRRYWIYSVIIVCGSLISLMSSYSPQPPLEKRVSAVMVISDSVSNYYTAKIIAINEKNLRFTIPILLSIKNVECGDTISTPIYIEPTSKYITAQKSLFSSMKREAVRYVCYTYENQPILRKSKQTITLAHKTQTAISDRLNHLTTYKENIAVLQAMMIGVKTNITPKSKMLYQKAGVAHTLAISGLHVGIIFLMLNLLMRWMNIFLWLRILKIVIIIGFLIFYAMISGSSPSVVRAVVMFSLFQLTLFTITSRYHAYNILFFAAFLMIVFDPTVIYKVSFQLSYVAIFAIIFFSARVQQWVKIENPPLRWIASTGLLSLCISLFTLPLVLYYFGQGALLAVASNIA